MRVVDGSQDGDEEPVTFRRQTKRPRTVRSPPPQATVTNHLTVQHAPAGLSTRTSGTRLSLFPRFSGLQNMGNTCYLNATLQMLFSLPNFLQALSAFDGSANPLVKAFCATNNQMLNATAAARPRRLKTTIDETVDNFCDAEQHDAHELLTCLLDKMVEEIQKGNKTMPTPINDFFKSSVKERRRCNSCGFSRYVSWHPCFPHHMRALTGSLLFCEWFQNIKLSLPPLFGNGSTIGSAMPR